MIVAGIGCRRNVSTDDVLAAVSATLAAHDIARDRLHALATAAFKYEERALRDAAIRLGVPLRLVDDTLMREGDCRTLTNSPVSRKASGYGSVAEAAALAAAGQDSRLAAPRRNLGPVSCAIAFSKDET